MHNKNPKKIQKNKKFRPKNEKKRKKNCQGHKFIQPFISEQKYLPFQLIEPVTLKCVWTKKVTKRSKVCPEVLKLRLSNNNESQTAINPTPSGGHFWRHKITPG